MLQALTDELVRRRYAYWIIGISLLVLALMGCYHVLGMGRDDLFVTAPIGNTGLFYTAPATTHSESKPYTLYIFHDPEPGGAPASTTALPSPIATAAVTATGQVPTLAPTSAPITATGQIVATAPITVALTRASGVMLLPNQSLTYTFTPGLYQSHPISYVNSFADDGPGVLSATITLASGGGEWPILLTRERWWQTLLRRLIYDSLASSVLTTLLPVLLTFLGGILLLRTTRLSQQLAKAETRVAQLIAPTTGDSPNAALESEVARALSELQKERNHLTEEQRKQLDLTSRIHEQVYPSLKTLRAGRAQDKAFININDDMRADLNLNGYKALASFLTDIAEYRQHKAETRADPQSPTSPLVISHNAPYPNERLAFLQHLGLLDEIRLEDVETLLTAHRENQLRLEKDLVDHFQRRCRLSAPPLPPRLPAETDICTRLFQLQLPPILAFDKDYLLLDERNQIIVVTGASGSGKSTALELLQKVKRDRSAIYLAPVDAQDLAAAPILVLVLLIERALSALHPSNPWLQLRPHDELWGNRPGGELKALTSLSDELKRLELDSLCLAIDNAPEGFDYTAIRQQAQELIHQKVYLRVALVAPPSHPIARRHIELVWVPDKLSELVDAINDRHHEKWAFAWKELSRNVLWRSGLVRTPHELLIWLYALRKCYDGDDIDWDKLQALCTEMIRARARRGPATTDWQLQDAQAALETLRHQ